jgi:hypothetical protein
MPFFNPNTISDRTLAEQVVILRRTGQQPPAPTPIVAFSRPPEENKLLLGRILIPGRWNTRHGDGKKKEDPDLFGWRQRQ